jgi:hypothetical protein
LKLIHISHLLQYASNLDGEKHLNVDLQKELAELKVHTELSMKVTIFLLIANVKSIVSYFNFITKDLTNDSFYLVITCTE